MALSASSLATRIKAAITEELGPPLVEGTVDTLANAIAKAVVAEIQSSLEATPTGLQDGNSLPVTGTIMPGDFD